MEKAYLIVNPGSASKKYTLYFDDAVFYDAHYENSSDGYLVTWQTPVLHKSLKVSDQEYKKSLQHFFDEVKQLNGKDFKLAKIGIRVVAPGEVFQTHQLVTNDVMTALKHASKNDPLHISAVVNELNGLHKIFPSIKVYAISDSAFHKSIDPAAQVIAINHKDVEDFGIKRYGYHGISVQAVITKVHKQHPELKNVIVCHLGSGSSVTAVKDGKSFDTSMGYTPLEGLVMSTRVGDIDAGALIALGKQKKLSYDELEEYLYLKSGLLGISGEDDMRRILETENNDTQSKLALDAFVYRIIKYIGAYAVAMDNLDAIVFTGTIGFRSVRIRSKIANNLHIIGVRFDDQANEKLSREGVITRANSRVKIFVLESDENREMLRILKTF